MDFILPVTNANTHTLVIHDKSALNEASLIPHAAEIRPCPTTLSAQTE